MGYSAIFTRNQYLEILEQQKETIKMSSFKLQNKNKLSEKPWHPRIPARYLSTAKSDFKALEIEMSENKSIELTKDEINLLLSHLSLSSNTATQLICAARNAKDNDSFSFFDAERKLLVNLIRKINLCRKNP